MRTPTIVGTIKHKSLQLDKEFNPKTEYIVKPIVGGLWKGIHNFEPTIHRKLEGEYIVQERGISGLSP